jgi:hypothetical protein
MFKVKLGAIALALVLLTQACKPEDPKPAAYTPPDGSYKLVFEKIFKPSCGLSNCHAQEGDFGHHGLVNDYTYEHLLTEEVKNNDALAAELKLIVPGDATNSYLYAKISWEDSPHQFGQKMPTGGLTLTDNQVEFVRQWIAAGAPETGHVADQTLLE